MSLSNNFVCMKYCLTLLNIFFVISGVVIISLGVYIKAFYYSYESFVTEQYLYAPDFLIALGAVIFVIAFVGCCGILMENSCMNITFTTFLALIFFFEMGVGLAGYIMKEEAKEYLLERLPITMAKYNTSADIHLAWDEIQTKFSCCGVRSSKDWEKYNISIPHSCYNSSPSTTETFTPILHDAGCLDAFGNFVKRHSHYIEVIGLTLAMLQLFGIISSCYLSSGYRKGYETV